METDWRIIEINGLRKKINLVRMISVLVMASEGLFIFISLFLKSVIYAVVPSWIFFFFFFVTFLVWYGTHALKFVKAWEEGVVFRFGRMLEKADKDEEMGFLNRIFKRFNPQKPGVVVVFWPFEKLVFVQMWTRAEDIEPKNIITKDLIEARLDILFYWKVIDSCDFVVKAQDPIPMAAEFTWATLRSEVGSRTFVEVYSGVKEINENLLEKLREAGFIEPQEDKGWGIEIKTIMIQNVIPPPGLSEAMLNLAISTQNAEAMRKTAAGKKDADIMEADAVKYRKIAEAEAESYRTQQLVKAYGERGAEILALTKISEMIQRGDKFFIDSDVAGIPAIATQLKEILGSSKKE